MKWFSALLLGAASVLGCNASTEAESHGTGDDDDSADMAALYRVPVPEELEPWSTYPVYGVELKQRGDEVKIEYFFPEWLVGEVQQVELEGTYSEGAASFPVSAGAFGSGECFVIGSRFECTEHLPGLIVDQAKAEALMHEAGLPADEVAQRLLVTQVFSVDPIGIIEIDAPR